MTKQIITERRSPRCKIFLEVFLTNGLLGDAIIEER
jgi:hypothetical protein